MGILIEGGANGVTARVTDDGRLNTQSEAVTFAEISAFDGRAYDANLTGTLTNAAESGVFFIKNLDPNRKIQFTRAILSFGISTGGTTGDMFVRLYANPTGGTLLAGAAVTPFNRNLGTVIPAQVDARSGGTGTTVTGGTLISTIILRATAVATIPTELVIATSTSLAITVQPATGNTSMAFAIVPVFAFTNSQDEI